MPNCPVCATPNADGSASCEQCSSVLPGSVSETVVSSSQQTVVATSEFASGLGVAAARAYSLELSPGTILVGRYEIVSRLGQGGMGVVYKALDKELDRTIALKTIRPDLVANPSSLRRLKQETLLARQVAHRNVIRVFDLGVAGGLRFITMEFVEGQDLRSVLDFRKKLPLDEAVAVLTQLGQGLAAAHNEDVVHRDLKPHNVIVSPDGRVRIMDFGLARSFEDTGTTQTGAILGTPAYMSPEQALGQPGDSRSDLFSFGVMAFELIAGELPFPNKTLSEALLSRTQNRAPALESIDPSLPGWLTRIVNRCLERRPADRYRNAQEVLEDLSNLGDFPKVRPPVSGLLSPGSMLGSRYRIEAEAGEGGMGKVYRATDLELQRTVALKIVRPDLAGHDARLGQLMHEISIASQISHKNVLRIHDVGELDGVRFVSMAWAEGEDLSQLLLRSAPLPEERIRQLAIDICDGLSAAHELGITHRDLKPSNILLTSGGHACIADFGLAQSSADPVVPLQVLESVSHSQRESIGSSGTPRYMSPEQAEGTSTDSRTDIYSLGLILYEMATGRIPFKDESVFQTITQRLTETPADPKLLNPALSRQLSATILRCLERDPQKRPDSVRALLAELQTEPLALAPFLEVKATHPRRPSRLWLFAALAAVVVLAVALVLFYKHAKVPEPPPNGKYIAVLPFRPIGSDPNLKYRAEGIADAVSARLASLSSLHPISANALERVSLSQPEEAISKQVGANLLVQGTVQEQGDRIKVIETIYNTEKHKAIWSKFYDREKADLFTLEDDIANDTEKALDVKPSLQEQERAAPAPTQNLAAYDLYLKGRDILKNHRDPSGAKESLGLFEQAYGKDQSFALARTGIADADLLLYANTGDSVFTSEALAAASEARDINPNLPEVHFALGSAYTATGRNAEAVSEIQRALQLAPNSDDGYIRLGKAYGATGQNEAALKAFKKAVELNPYYWYNHKQLGVGYLDVGRNDEALKQFKEQIAENPSDPSGYNNIGAAYFQQGRWKDCISPFKKAIEIKPSFSSYSNLGTANYYLGHYAEAVTLYEKALATSPNHPTVLRNLAEAYRQTGQLNKSGETFNRAISLLYQHLQVNPRNASTLAVLGLCYSGTGQPSKARQFIMQARAIDASDPKLMYDEAVVDVADGRMDDALKALTRALENGYPWEYCRTDPELKTLRKMPAFAALTKQFAHPAEARRR